MNNLSDAELIERFRKGQIQAFNLLAWRWQKPILNFLYRFLGNVQDAEDACQKTFIKVYQKLMGLQDLNKFRVWLYQVAANQARDQLRHRKRHSFFSINSNSASNSNMDDEIVPELPDPESNNLEGNAHGKQLRQIFEEAMQTIPEEQRAVIVMKVYQDLKFIEISEVLKLPLNTVKSRMYYGLKALKETLKKQNLSEEALSYEM